MLDRNVTECAARMRRFLSEDVINPIGLETAFSQRMRKLTPVRAVWTFTTALGSGTVNTLADIVRLFGDLTGERIEYKPFHDRLSNPTFPELMRSTLSSVMGKLTAPVLSGKSRHLKAFSDILLQDGSSFAVNEALKEAFPGRFTKVSPAAVEVHCTYSLYQAQAVEIGLSPDKDAERTYLPDPVSLKGKLILFDRGYTCYEYGTAVKVAGGDFIGRAKDKNFNPTILKCFRGFGCKRALVGKRLKEVKLPRCNVDLLIEGEDKHGKKHQVRLVLFYVKRKDVHLYLLTSLSPQQYSPNIVASLYRLRWQVELFFKECKSYTKLKKFQTKDQFIVEGLIWASMLAILIRRFLLHSAFSNTGKRVAHFIAAAMSWTFFRSLGRAVLREVHALREVLTEVLRFLRETAERTNPHRKDTFVLLYITPRKAYG
jgi:hypothetical protein